jgi:carbon storage regulator
MLALTRRIGEAIVIDGGIRVRVVRVQGDRVRLAIEAPASVRVDREEVRERLVRDGFLDEPDPTPTVLAG